MAELDPLAEVRKRLAARITDPKSMLLPGLREDLSAIMGALTELERRIGVVAVVELQKHYRPACNLHEAVWKSLAEMSDHARAVYRIGVHGERCVCIECMTQGRGAYERKP